MRAYFFKPFRSVWPRAFLCHLPGTSCYAAQLPCEQKELLSARTSLVAFLVAAVCLSKALNDYFSKIKASTLQIDGKEFNWVTAIPDGMVYLGFNGGMLAIQYFRGRVTRDELMFVTKCGLSWKEMGAWKYLVVAAISDVADNLTGLAAQPYLTTFMFALANQATTVFTAAFSAALVGTRYIAQEVISIIVILSAALMGVVLAASSDETNSHVGWAIFAAATTSFAALGFVVKEIMFAQYKLFRINSNPELLEGFTHEPLASMPRDKNLSVFVVSTGVGFVGVVVSIPMALIQQTLLSGGFEVAWQDLQDGLYFLGSEHSALFAYLVYVVCNVCFNLSLLLLTSHGSALMAFLSLKLAVPIIAILSPLPWPVIGPHPVNGSTWMILVVMLVALATYRHGTVQRETKRLNFCCWPLCSSGIPASGQEGA